MAKKTLIGIVVSVKMNNSVVVEVTRKMPHEKYRKLITKSKKFIADSQGVEVKEGDVVTIYETRKMAGNKHFKVEGKEKLT